MFWEATLKAFLLSKTEIVSRMYCPQRMRNVLTYEFASFADVISKHRLVLGSDIFRTGFRIL